MLALAARKACEAALHGGRRAQEVYEHLETCCAELGLDPVNEVDLHYSFRESLTYSLDEDLPDDESCLSYVLQALHEGRQMMVFSGAEEAYTSD